MIKAQFSTDKESGSIILRVTGHAGAAEKGQDIICASASMLAYTVAQSMMFMFEQGDLRKKPTIKIKEGDSLVVARPKKDSYAEALHTFFVAQVGFHLLSHNYPQYVTLVSFGDSEA